MSHHTSSGANSRGSNRRKSSRATPAQGPALKDATSRPLLFSGLGGVIAEIPNSNPPSHPTSDRLVTGLTALASYSWLESSQPSIVVPGAPPVWRQPSLPLKLHKGKGKQFSDQNAFRISKYPLLPLVSAVQCEQAAGSDVFSEFKFSTIDVVSDRNGLRKLLRWIQGGKSVKDFRIDVQLAGSTVLFTRRETQNQDYGSGFGKAFELATTHRNPDETGHHRIITYTLCGMKLLVRFELDACLPEAVPHTPIAGQARIATPTTALDNKSISAPVPVINSAHVTVIQGGELVAQSGTMELKSSSGQAGNDYNWKEAYSQLVLSQTQHLALGWHNGGTFNTIERKTLQELEQGPVGRAHHNNLVKLGDALKRICALVK